MLRVCHVTYSFYETDNRVMRYAETLAAMGDHVDVIALRSAGLEASSLINGVRVLRIQRRVLNESASWHYLLKIGWFFLKCLILLAFRSMSVRYDVVHVHNIPDFLVFSAAVPRLLGSRVILDIHDIVPELYGGKFGARNDSALFRGLLAVERWSCQFAHHVFVANHLWHERLVRRSAQPSRCSVVLNHPDLTLFKPCPATRSRKGRFLFLYPGTLNQHQGLDVAISAFALAYPQMPNAEFHIYGDGPAREALCQQVTALKLGERIRIMDRVPLRKVGSIMTSADVGVEPKTGAGFGDEALSTKILEFMACAVPVIVSRTTIHARYFADDLVTYYAPGDARDLASCMVRAYRGLEGSEARVARALEFARSNGWQAHVGDYLGVIEQLTGVSRQAAGRMA